MNSEEGKRGRVREIVCERDRETETEEVRSFYLLEVLDVFCCCDSIVFT